MEIHDNSEIFLKNLWVPFDGPVPTQRQGRRVISMIGGKPRIFSGVVYGSDVLKPLGESSLSSISLGKPLPSCTEMLRREQEQKILQEAEDHPEKIPVLEREEIGPKYNFQRPAPWRT